jgi:hypothetical protein
MRYSMTRPILIFWIFISTVSLGQTSIYKPFKMIIIAPDTATIEDNLKVLIDTVEQNYIRRYYYSLKQMEDLLNFKESDEMKKEFEKNRERLEKNLKAARSLETEIKKFKYFETIPIYTSEVFQLFFNEYPPNSVFQVVRKSSLKSDNPERIANEYGADYVVTYKDIHTDSKGGQTIMRITTTLYSKKMRKVLWEKKNTGDMNSYGDMWTCLDPLSCLLITSVRSTSEEIYETVSKLQQR